MNDSGSIKKTFLDELKAVASLSGLQQLRITYLGKKGILTTQLKSLSSLPAEERKPLAKQ